jgi:hypothetical protein
MQIQIDSRLDSSLLPRLHKANEMLRDIIGPSREENVLVDWQAGADNHKPHLRLKVARPPDQVETKIAVDDLKDEEKLWMTLVRLWGDVLEIRSHRQIRELLEVEEATQS